MNPDGLTSLPTHDVPAEARERLKQRSLSMLAYQRRLANRPWLARADRVYTRFVEPTLVAATAIAYVSWAVLNVFGPH